MAINNQLNNHNKLGCAIIVFRYVCGIASLINYRNHSSHAINLRLIIEPFLQQFVAPIKTTASAYENR